MHPPPHCELILGGQKSGKSRWAEQRAQDWLQSQNGRRAVLLATGQAWDEEMRERIARHRADRARRVPGLETVEEAFHLDQALSQHSRPDTLVVVDCLTLWLTQWMMPAGPVPVGGPPIDGLLQSLRRTAGPVVLVGNEIGLGVIPLGAEVRAFVDALGQLNQAVAAVCDRLTLMVAGCPLTVKGA